MKILVVSRTALKLNGVSSVITNLYSQPVFEKDEITFIFPSIQSDYYRKRLETENHKVEVLDNKSPFRYYFSLKKRLRDGKYDGIHIHGSSATTFIETHAAKKVGIKKIIVHSHNSNCSHPFIHKLLKPFLNRELTDAVSCSEMAGKWLFSVPFRIVPNGINVDHFAFDEKARKLIRVELGFNENDLVIGTVARLSKVKNQEYILRILRDLLSTRINAKVLIVGDGESREELIRTTSDLGLSGCVVFLGNREDVSRYYSAMDVFVLPSLYEGLPVTLIEAQASGLKCIASSNVTRMCKTCDLVSFLPIGLENIHLWVKELSLISVGYDRKEHYKEIQGSPFNIQTSASLMKKVFGNE